MHANLITVSKYDISKMPGSESLDPFLAALISRPFDRIQNRTKKARLNMVCTDTHRTRLQSSMVVGPAGAKTNEQQLRKG